MLFLAVLSTAMKKLMFFASSAPRAKRAVNIKSHTCKAVLGTIISEDSICLLGLFYER
jgi:hypothetical protein